MSKDVTYSEDFQFFCQNAIALENHLIMSYCKIKEQRYLEMAKIVRRLRSQWLNRFVNENNAENYCCIKHTLACACAMKELGNRFIEDNDEKTAKECFDDAGTFEALAELINKKGGK